MGIKFVVFQVNDHSRFSAYCVSSSLAMIACKEIFGRCTPATVVSWRAGLEAYLELKAIQREA
jgi:hypothetical protein